MSNRKLGSVVLFNKKSRKATCRQLLQRQKRSPMNQILQNKILELKVRSYKPDVDVECLNPRPPISYFMRACTTALALRFLRSVYVCPVPTNMIGWPVMYVIEMEDPT